MTDPAAARSRPAHQEKEDEELVSHQFNSRTPYEPGDDRDIWCKDCEYHRDHHIHARVAPSVPCVAPTGSTAERPTGAVTAAEQPDKHRIWAGWCPFKKSGFPCFGNFGYTERAVIVIPAETWTRLCREIPELGKREFEVGTQD